MLKQRMCVCAPLFPLEPLSRTLGADNECWYSDEDNAERLERRLKGAVVREATMCVVGCGERECETAGEALETADYSGTLLRVLLFFRDNLRSHPSEAARGGQRGRAYLHVASASSKGKEERDVGVDSDIWLSVLG